MRKEPLIGAGIILAIAVLVGVGLWRTAGRPASGRITLCRQPQRVMGTTCTLTLVTEHGRSAQARRALGQAEAALRAAEARMSVWLAESEISRFNTAAAGEVPLSAETLEVLRAAEQAAIQTGGAFDVTCRPLIELWKRAGERGAPPADAELIRARSASQWALIELTGQGAIKRSAAACVDLGGIAKGHAIDRAADVMRQAGVLGAVIDVGGDLRCCGRPAHGRSWPVDVRNPFGPGRLAKFRIPGGAVCTSGNYARYIEIGGRRYGSIVDPRTGRPADAAQAVTVLAPTALTADIWATALCVLGPKGFAELPDDVEALMVVGSKDDYQILCTAGFLDLLEKPLPERLASPTGAFPTKTSASPGHFSNAGPKSASGSWGSYRS
jgi:thiamine biosynthesis lipoprotein